MLKAFLQNEINVLRTAHRRGRERKVLFLGMVNLMFYALNAIGLEIWSLILVEMVQNISNRRNIRARIRFDLNDNTAALGNVILGNNSGFQKLAHLVESKVFLLLSIINYEFFKLDVSSLCQDEEKYFAAKFNEFYSNPQIKNSINVGNILSVPQQVDLRK